MGRVVVDRVLSLDNVGYWDRYWWAGYGDLSSLWNGRTKRPLLVLLVVLPDR